MAIYSLSPKGSVRERPVPGIIPRLTKTVNNAMEKKPTLQLVDN